MWFFRDILWDTLGGWSASSVLKWPYFKVLYILGWPDFHCYFERFQIWLILKPTVQASPGLWSDYVVFRYLETARNVAEKSLRWWDYMTIIKHVIRIIIIPDDLYQLIIIYPWGIPSFGHKSKKSINSKAIASGKSTFQECAETGASSGRHDVFFGGEDFRVPPFVDMCFRCFYMVFYEMKTISNPRTKQTLHYIASGCFT